jgi:trk system potassium uptake protein TrkA
MTKMNQPNQHNRIVIVGCGRLGSLLAGRLSRDGQEVVIIDLREEAFCLLPPEFSGFRFAGNAIEHEVMRSVSLEQAGVLIAVTEKDTVNLMVAEVGHKIFNVPRVLARVYDPNNEELYRDTDIVTISPTQLTAKAFLLALFPE